MAKLDEAQLQALHFHRALNGGWYVVGNFSDKTVGKKGQHIISDQVPPAIMNQLLVLLTKEE